MTLFPPAPSSSTASVDTYSSLLDDDDDDDGPAPLYRPDATPVGLPPRYRPAGADPPPRPSDPHSFGRLFPSLDRLAVRHDDASPDGNMSLRVETVVAPRAAGRRRAAATTVQLFHLRMRDLARRDFSLRRYGRDSGREVCACKRAYDARPSSSSPSRSVSAALRELKAPFRRPASSASSASSAASLFSRRPSTPGSLSPERRRPSTDSAASSPSVAASPSPRPLLVPTDTIKLEFSNYARVHVRRRGDKRYEFDWWGRSYAWKRAVDKTLGTVSFHLVRDGHRDPVAHIVPEVRSPNQLDAEDRAGGWIPPCYMWISDPAVVEAVTDVAE